MLLKELYFKFWFEKKEIQTFPGACAMQEKVLIQLPQNTKKLMLEVLFQTFCFKIVFFDNNLAK